MSFNSIEYLLFLALVVAAAWNLRHRRANLALLGASYLFYAAWDWRFLALLAISTVIGYRAGLAIDAAGSEIARRRIMITRVALNLVMLGVFKYAGFFVSSASGVLAGLGLEHQDPTLRIILPVAISYYTFEEISYTVDIYRRRIEPCRDPVAYGLFVAFFPKLVAGPILRPCELLPQITAPRPRPDLDRGLLAGGLFLRGLVKKVVVADTLATFVDATLAEPDQQGAVMLVVATLCFAGQIYGDFSGYTDLARAAATLLGFDLPENFRQPYLSNSITAFWRTWHISLSTWLRDYLYIPLGGNRRSPRRTQINLMTVMVLGGLWHGAGWTFVIWGAIHGGALALERVRGTAADNSEQVPSLGQVPAILSTFAVVSLAWVFFRAPDLDAALTVLWRIVTLRPGEIVWTAVIWLVVGALVLGLGDLRERRRLLLAGEAAPSALSRPGRSGLLAGASLVGLVVTAGSAPVPFLYFQF